MNRIFIIVSLSSQTYSYSEGDAPEKQKSTEIICLKIVAHDHIPVSVRVTHFTLGIFNITRTNVEDVDTQCNVIFTCTVQETIVRFKWVFSISE